MWRTRLRVLVAQEWFWPTMLFCSPLILGVLAWLAPIAAFVALVALPCWLGYRLVRWEMRRRARMEQERRMAQVTEPEPEAPPAPQPTLEEKLTAAREQYARQVGAIDMMPLPDESRQALKESLEEQFMGKVRDLLG